MAGVGPLLAAFLFAAQAQVAPEPPTTSFTEIRRMTPDAIVRLLFGRDRPDLPRRPAFSPMGDYRDDPLRVLRFRTDGRSSGYARLCRTTEVALEFEPVGPLQGAATRVRQRRATTRELYFLYDERTSPSEAAMTEAEAGIDEMNCKRADQGPGWTFDPSSGAMRDARAARDLVETILAAMDAEPLPPIDCSRAHLSRTACIHLLGAIRESDVRSVGPCPGAASSQCMAFELVFYPGVAPIPAMRLSFERQGAAERPSRILVETSARTETDGPTSD